MKFIQHLPAYFDDSIPRFEYEFEKTGDLLRLKEISEWAKDPNFFRFSQNVDRKTTRTYLIAENNDGKKRYVLGYVEGILDLGLPEWNIGLWKMK